MTEVVESILNTKSSYNDCDHCSSVLSPAAYFVKLMETVEKYITQSTKSLKERRPDLYNIKLDCNNTNKEKLYLEIVNEIMGENLKKGSNGDILQKLATAKYPFNLPANFPLISIRAYLREHNISLAEVCKALISNVDTTLENLDLSPEAYQMIISNDTTGGYLKKAYGTQSLDQLKKVEKFIAQTDIDDKLKLLLDSYNKVKKPAKLSIDSTNQTITNLDNQALGFLHRFIRLANKLSWSFEELSDVLIAVGKDEINEDFVKQIARIKNLQERFKQPVDQIAELYAQADILSKKLKNRSEFESLLSKNYTKLQDLVVSANEHSVNGYSTLQNILSVNSSELIFLIEYNDSKSSSSQTQTGRALLFRVYKQVSLARLIGISIAEITQFLSLLNIDELNLDNIEHVVELNDWLKNHSITIEQLNKLISFSDEKLVEQIRISLNSSSILLLEQLRKKIQESINLPDEQLKKQIKNELAGFSDEQLKEQIQNILSKYSGDQLKEKLNHLLQKIKEENLHNFYNIIHEHIGNLQPDMLAAVHKFTDPQESQVFSDVLAKLIHNIEVLTKLKLSAEDISNITKHKDAYGMQAEWSLSQIRTLLNYKTLKDIFSSGSITLPQYTDWLNGTDYNENKVVEKIAQLTGWNEDILENIKKVEAFKPCFAKTQNPIDSLLKIKSLMDLVTKSGINSKVLLSLKNLYNLEVGSDNNKWKKYTDAARNLELSAGSEAKDEAEKYLAEQKRDILAKYMINEYKLKNMRDLYSYLLIDVEMSDCSVISPLKAALNSVQLYIHRSMMKLEEGVTIKPELNEEKWKWLSHYREWEASNKIKLYPENYLNPTLRRIKTPGYKTLQNTLMQGNITDEAVSNAYMKYFEDFEEVTSLKIVDSCFERVEDKISGGEKNTLYIIGHTLAQPYNYYYRTAIFDEKNQQILYWTAWEKIGASIPVETVTPIYAFHRLFLFWVQQTKKKNIDMTKYNGGKDSPLSENAHVAINYIFQKPSGSWTAPQKLADNIEVNNIADVDKLYWKKVAAFYLKEKGVEERSVVISIGKINSGESCSFILDEDLVVSKGKSGCFLDGIHYDIHKYDLRKNIERIEISKAVVDDKVILFGGRKDSEYSKKIDVYDNTTGRWLSYEASEARNRVSAAVIGDKAIFFGGECQDRYSKKIDIYDSTRNEWTTATASEGRSFASSAVVGNKAIFFSGIIGIDRYSSKVDIYDSVKNEWTIAAISEGRMFASSAVVGNKAIFFGGQMLMNNGPSSKIDIYDSIENRWTNTKASEGRAFPSSAVVGNKAIFFGGQMLMNNGPSSKIDIYDSIENRWTNTKASEGRAFPSSAVVGNKAIFFGGKCQDRCSDKIDIYDSTRNEWTTATASEGRVLASSAIVGNKAIFFGGKCQDRCSDKIDIYDSTRNEWTTATASEGRVLASSAIVGNKAIFFGGECQDRYSKKIDIYDSTRNEWTTATASEGRSFASSAVVGNKAIFFSGIIGMDRYSSKVNIYDSQSDRWEDLELDDVIKENVGIMVQDNQIASFAVDSSGNILKYVYSYPHLLLFSYDVVRNRDGKLSMNSTSNVFESNVTNKEDIAELVPGTSAIELLGKFKISSAQQIVNKPGWFIIEGNLERENVRESFLLFPKGYDLSSISERSTYKVDNEKVEFEYKSKISQVDLTDTVFEFMRLNITGSVRKLRQKAYAGGPKRILTLDSQKIKQPDFTRFQPADAVAHYPPDILDFSGAYSIYLWEIFFHIPTLIAWHLNGEQNFSAAREWYQYILNPTNDKSQAWKFLPFTNCSEESITNDLGNTQTIKELEVDPFDPYVIAKQRPTAFEKYIIKSYVDNLINWGDMLFAKKSWEALNQATMLYVRAWDLLGHKPVKKGKFTVETKTFEELKSNQKSSNLCKLEAELPSINVQLTSTHEVYDMSKYGCYFCKPENEEFIGLWDKIEDRLYKIRHCLDITGKRLELPLFQAPIDPRQLIQTISASGSSVTVPSIDQLPHYRFSYMIAYARSIVETVIQFGSELLSVLEKRDAEALAILYNKQEGIIANLITSIKEKAIEALKEEAKALDASLSSAKDRESHYENLINSGLSAGEILATALSADAVLTRVGIATVRGAAAVAHLIPTVFGFADGAFQPGSAIAEGANIAESAAMILNEGAQIAYTVASYKRRAEDWELQKTMASHDTEQINCQIKTNKVNQSNAEQDLKAHKKSIEQIKEKEEFFKNKFTNQELYNWMKGQITIIYFQAYKIALEIAKQAEKTYQYELNNNKSFITNSSWDSLKEGLLAGSVLKFALEQMAKGYHDENKRTLEISKVVSLGQIDPIALHDLKTKGSCKFALTERLFDLDFPGHYCRKIKNIKITIPAVVGPYENIHASLQQTSNKVVLKPDIKAIKYLLGESDSSKPENDVLRENWQQNQEIALSRGDQDSGLFELNFNDERYLPFEGTGVVSCWELSLPKATNRFDTNKISDVIIHIDYTAFNEGNLAKQVKELSKLKYYHGMLLVNLSITYPDAWEKFKQIQSGPHELKFKPSAEIFPAYFKNPEIDSNKSVKIIPEAPSVEKIQLNDSDWKKDTFEVAGTFTIGSEWTLKINNADINKIEKIVVIIPYKAEINW
ncbi:Tc toxin subunit A [Wolbachia endosymbiont of Delia radicum]|uniref:Tc toxin subunit A-related protein n=1 Tax=Wolbachia endosymbiont of Delia radicum TaxID=502352 RepID=UPI001EECCB4D|nr:neuraminidase-like domain-containing protein [Wolbachia endosymbiont of Delia radicum]UJQ20368.1 Tc toxin subunit A [Wolbachia endosymbiont of Delia radicum]